MSATAENPATTEQNTAETGKLQRRERERQRHRLEILQAAERVFAQRGFSGATVEEIAREADFAVGTIYNFFAGKEQLCTEVIHGIVRRFMKDFEREVSGLDDPLAALAALLGLRFRYYDQHHSLFRDFFALSPRRHIHDPAHMLPKKCRPLHEQYTIVVTSIIARGIDRGLFAADEPLFLALGAEGIVNAFLTHWAHQADSNPTAAQRQRVLQLVLRMLGADAAKAPDQ